MMAYALVIASAAGAERMTRGYYVGKHEPRGVDLMKLVDDAEAESVARPFESPLLGAGDTLVDIRETWGERFRVEGEIDEVLYNRTTGYLVVRGEEAAHEVAGALGRRLSWELLQSVKIRLEFFEDEESALIVSSQVMSGKSASMVAETRERSVEVTATCYLDPNDEVIELKLSIEGKVGDAALALESQFYLLNERPVRVSLGRLSDGKSSTLEVIGTALYDGGLMQEALVLNQNGDRVGFDGSHLLAENFIKRVRDPVSQRIFTAFLTHDTFASFLMEDDEAVPAGIDPFGTDRFEPGESESRLKKVAPQLAEWDDRVLARPSDRVVDLKNLLEKAGVTFGDGDFVVLNSETDTVFAEVSEESCDLIEAILAPGPRELPRYVRFSYGLMRTDKEISNLTDSDVKRSVFWLGSLPVSFGRKQKLQFGENQMVINVAGGSTQWLVEAQYEFAQKSEREGLRRCRGLLELVSGVPVPVGSVRVGDVWESLVIMAEVVQVGGED